MKNAQKSTHTLTHTTVWPFPLCSVLWFCLVWTIWLATSQIAHISILSAPQIRAIYAKYQTKKYNLTRSNVDGVCIPWPRRFCSIKCYFDQPIVNIGIVQHVVCVLLLAVEFIIINQRKKNNNKNQMETKYR